VGIVEAEVGGAEEDLEEHVGHSFGSILIAREEGEGCGEAGVDD